ncbi:MAG: extracellular solute-binding protein [Spirochaetia bacterium]|nr:extracellular solute-binding protein [Spirochaetia bacterium]
MVRKKILMVLVVAGLIAPAVFAGGQKEASDTAAFDPDKTYNVSLGAFGDLEAAYAEVFASEDFKSQYPNINVTFQSADFGGHHDRLTTQLAAREQTNDIEALEVQFIANFVEQGDSLVNLNEAPYNAADVIGDVVDFAVAQGQTRAGEQVAIPVDIAPAVLFYRADLAEEAGADFKNLDSWDAYIEEGRKVTGDGRYAVPNAADVANIPLAGGKGGWISEDGDLLEPKSKFMEALQLVADVRAAGIDADLGAWSGPWIDSFSNGTVVTMPNGAWWGGALRNWVAPEVEDWRVTYLPGGALSSLGGTYLSIPATVPEENRAAAWEIIKYLTTTEEAQLKTFAEIDAFPALTSTYDNPIMGEPVAYFGNEPVREIFADVALNMPSNRVSEYDNIIVSIWGSIVGEVLEGDLTPEEAYDKALSQIQSTID